MCFAKPGFQGARMKIISICFAQFLSLKMNKKFMLNTANRRSVLKRNNIAKGFLRTIALFVVIVFQTHTNSWAQDPDLVKAEDVLKRVSVLFEHGQKDKAELLLEKFYSHLAKANDKVVQLYRQGQYHSAVSIAQSVLKLMEKSFGSEHPDTADSLNNLAMLYDGMGSYQKAEPLYKRALAIQEKTLGPVHPRTAASLNNLAGLYQAMSAYQKAEPLYKRALAIREKALGSEHPDTADSLNNLAGLYQAIGSYQKAEPLYKRALTINEKALGPEHPYVATSLNGLASLYCAMGSYQKAEPLYKRALAIREKAFGSRSMRTAAILNNLAGLYHTIGSYQKAEPLLKKTLTINEKILGPMHSSTAVSLNNLAVLYQIMGSYQKAEPLYKRALAIQEKTLGPVHPRTAVSLNRLGSLYQAMGAYQKAEPLYKRALAIREKALGSEHPDTVDSLNNLAGLYLVVGAYQKAEPIYKRALAITEKTLGIMHPSTAFSLNNMASLYRAMGAYEEAEPLYKRALAIQEKTLGPMHPRTATILSNLSGLYYATGAYQKAELLLNRAVSVQKQTRELNSGIIVFNGLGTLYLAQGRFEEGLVQIKKGIALFETVRSDFNQGERRSSFQSTRGDYYGLLCSTYLAMGEVPQAFEALERGRAKSFMDLLGTRQVDRSKTHHQTERLALLVDKLAKTREQKSVVLALPKGRKTRSAQLDQQISALDKKRLEVIEEIKKADPELASLVSVEPTSLSEIQSLLDPDVVVVEYYHMGGNVVAGEKRDQLWIFVAHKNGLHFQSVNVTRTELRSDLNDYARLLANPDSDLTKLQNLSAKLHGWLVAPLDPVIKIVAPNTLVVVPWGPLFKVPFASLAPTGKRPFGSKYNMVVTPSAGLYRYLVRKRSSGRKSCYAVGNPKTAMAPLPGAEKEAHRIAQFFKVSTVHTRTQATESRLKTGYGALGQPDVVHLASHGIFNEAIPQFSYLALTPDQKNDGRLEMHEVFGLDWQGISLVSLSACSSGKGKLGGGQDLVGLVRGFMFAGAPSVLASLWDVDDEATQALMMSFYKNYVDGMTTPQALRKAQMAMMDSGKWSHPYFWSAFVLFGDWK
jgi:CHAT domain-containing protein/Tfp pilus assembly protein PilF